MSPSTSAASSAAGAAATLSCQDFWPVPFPSRKEIGEISVFGDLSFASLPDLYRRTKGRTK
jgi:hypothetical protein